MVKHLAVLSRAGLVAGQREGREVRYVARPEGLAATARWMTELAAEWDQRLRPTSSASPNQDDRSGTTGRYTQAPSAA